MTVTVFCIGVIQTCSTMCCLLTCVPSLNLCLYYIRQPLEHLLDVYGNSFVVQNLAGTGVILVVFAGGLLGFLGAWLSVQRYLRQISDGGIPGRR